MARDTLGVLETTEPVAEAAGYVAIESDLVEQVADSLASRPFRPPPWRVWPHFWGDPEHTANYVLLLDALNFCFWGDPKWQVEYEGRTFDGYAALAAALRRAIDEGKPILEADYLAELSREQLERLLRGRGTLHLLDARLRHAREVGFVLGERYGGSFARFIVEQGQGSVVRLVRSLVREFPSFNDVAAYQGREVRFYKRAQLLASDLYGAFEGQSFGGFGDLERLTAFADYKVPQVLRELGILAYAAELAEAVDHQRPLAAGSPAEVEIRAATILAVEYLRRALAARGVAVRAFELDWHLWTLGQELRAPCPYHRTLTAAY
ncbi:MAG: hypothetical protein HY690_08915 [Chloroflexi bacterium]|nr:hypothetical protein [Chloroflexota bacterium]